MLLKEAFPFWDSPFLRMSPYRTLLSLFSKPLIRLMLIGTATQLSVLIIIIVVNDRTAFYYIRNNLKSNGFVSSTFVFNENFSGRLLLFSLIPSKFPAPSVLLCLP